MNRFSLTTTLALFASLLASGGLSAIDAVTTITYDQPLTADGLEPIVVTDALGHTTMQYRDGAGHVVRTVAPGGGIITAAYDANGNLIRQRGADGVGIDASYDALNRRVQQSDTAGATQRWAYDVQGNVVGETDALNQTTTRVYDGLNRKISETDRVNATTRFAYDAAGNLLTITDAEGGVTSYGYDNRGLLVSETFPAGQKTPDAAHPDRRTYTYDPGRRLATRTDQAGVTATYRYDAANRLTDRIYSSGAGNDHFVYDAGGRLTTATSGRYGVTVTRRYDAAGRLLGETQALGDATYAVGYAYDLLDRVVATTYPDGRVASRGWSDDGFLTGIGLPGTGVIQRTYDTAGNLLTTTFPNGLVETRITTPGDHTVASLSVPGVTSLGYAYDAAKRKQSESGSLAAQTFHYDTAGRLTDWAQTALTGGAPASAQSWQLSPVGDWQSTTRDGLTETRTHTAVHEATALTAAGATTPLAYDAKGNLITDQTGAAYTWDDENRLATATIADDAHVATGLARYRYDALGRRVQKIVFGRQTTFVLAGAQVIEELDAPVTLDASAANDDGTAANLTKTPPGGALIDDALVRVNFQPPTSPLPDGFVADKGKTLAARTNGFSYGWAAARSDHTVARGVFPYPQYDTHDRAADGTGATQTNVGTWTIALPNGTYAVALVMGDPTTMQQTDDVLINGVKQTDLTPATTPTSTAERGNFDGYAVTATVTNGALTITVPPSAFDPRLCFIEIGKAGSTADAALKQKVADAVATANALTDSDFPPRSTSPRTYVYSGGYVDDVVMMESGSGASAKRYYVHSNHLYSPAALTDSIGAVVERFAYSAYGQQTITSATGSNLIRSSVGFSRSFTGYILDQETGMCYARERMYLSRLGRFVGRDPKGYVSGPSLYVGYFVPNMVDPSGTINISIDTNAPDFDNGSLLGGMDAKIEWSKGELCQCSKVYWHQDVTSELDIWYQRAMYTAGYVINRGNPRADGGEVYPFQDGGVYNGSNHVSITDSPGFESLFGGDATVGWGPAFTSYRYLVYTSVNFRTTAKCLKKDGTTTDIFSFNWGYTWQRDELLPGGTISSSSYPNGIRKKIPDLAR